MTYTFSNSSNFDLWPCHTIQKYTDVDHSTDDYPVFKFPEQTCNKSDPQRHLINFSSPPDWQNIMIFDHENNCTDDYGSQRRFRNKPEKFNNLINDTKFLQVYYVFLSQTDNNFPKIHNYYNYK